MTNSMLEKAARAVIADQYAGRGFSPAAIETCVEADWVSSRRDVCLRAVRAVLAAIREPDEAMMDAGEDLTRDTLADPALVWTSMIDSILKESTPQ